MDSDSTPSPTVVVSKDGPYLVTGPVTVQYQVIATDGDGASWTWKQGETVPAGKKFSLCRCGHSSSKPFCDDTHLAVGFDGTETASRDSYDELADVLDGPTMRLGDASSLCGSARFCDGQGSAWKNAKASSDDATRQVVAHEASHCPSGRLVAYDKLAGGSALEPALEPGIGLVEDPAEGVSGGLWLRGGIGVSSEDGEPYAVRNRTLLCRCGASSNKPFCDGSHITTHFTDDRLSGVDQLTDGTDSVPTPPTV
jgi:CDGSH-type Zn-finger protein